MAPNHRLPDSLCAFGKDAKTRQGNFRDTSSSITLAGRSPSDDMGVKYKHLLALGCEHENLYPGIRGDSGAIDFFRARNLGWWRFRGDSRDNHGPTRNMASSQISCVNFLLPLARIPGALTAAISAIDDDVCGIVNIHHEGNTSPVEFEWIGPDLSLEGVRTRGSNSTSIDAFLVAETSAGRRRAYLLEWKYTEKYLRKSPTFKGTGRDGDTRRRRYGDLYHADSSSFKLEAVPDMEEFFYEPFYQIMRQRLLADRMVQQHQLGVDEAKVVVVVPEENLAYRSFTCGSKTTSPPLAQRFPQLTTVEEVMRDSLKDPDTQFAMVAPHTMLDAVLAACPDEAARWVEYWRERYWV